MKIFIFLMSFSGVVPAHAAKVSVAYFTKQPASFFETKVKPAFEEFSAKCDCELKNLTPYNSKGEYDSSRFVEALGQAREGSDIVFIDWNERSTEDNRKLPAQISEKMGSMEKVLIVSAGTPPNNEGACPLNGTLMGQVPEAHIVGELQERERLLPQCYYGPEMLTAVAPPKEYMRQGLAPLYFVAKLASHWNKRKPAEWSPYMKTKKGKSKKLWPEVEDFFPR